MQEDVTMREGEIDRLSHILGEKDAELADLEDQLDSSGKQVYAAAKGDAVDEFLAKYVNLMQCKVPIKRLGNGFYMFGTRKIFAKIMNGKLVIRVGGGYMTIEEFIATYADQEINRCKLLEAQDRLAHEHELEAGPGVARRGSTMVVKQSKSPRASIVAAGSPRMSHAYTKINLGGK